MLFFTREKVQTSFSKNIKPTPMGRSNIFDVSEKNVCPLANLLCGVFFFYRSISTPQLSEEMLVFAFISTSTPTSF